MKTTKASPDVLVVVSTIVELRENDLEDMLDSFGKTRLTCGIEALQGMMEEDAEPAGVGHEHYPDKSDYWWWSANSQIDLHG